MHRELKLMLKFEQATSQLRGIDDPIPWRSSLSKVFPTTSTVYSTFWPRKKTLYIFHEKKKKKDNNPCKIRLYLVMKLLNSKNTWSNNLIANLSLRIGIMTEKVYLYLWYSKKIGRIIMTINGNQYLWLKSKNYEPLDLVIVVVGQTTNLS